jgi:hypothetical protein
MLPGGQDPQGQQVCVCDMQLPGQKVEIPRHAGCVPPTLMLRAVLAERPADDSPAADAATRAAAGAAPGASATQRTGGSARAALALLLTRRQHPRRARAGGAWLGEWRAVSTLCCTVSWFAWADASRTPAC